jgi:hypothetical protein
MQYIGPFDWYLFHLYNHVSTDEPDNFVFPAPRRFRRSRAGNGSNDGRNANNHGRIQRSSNVKPKSSNYSSQTHNPFFSSYVLTRHLKQTETIHPPPPVTPELGKFRGEPVYPRSSVVSLKTAENWMRNTGRTVIAGEQPMKMVKMRAGTVNRMRELEVLKDDLRVAGHDAPNGHDEGPLSAAAEIMQGLYAYSQTEPYIPDPVVDVGFNHLSKLLGLDQQ